MKIMIVEDHQSIREELRIFLEKNGYDVVVLTHFESVVEQVLQEAPDLLLLDLNLPFNDGHYICRQIRKRSSLPIIVVTVQDTEMDELLSMELGADDFITKPYNTRILLARIQAVLKRSAYREQQEILYGGVRLDLDNRKITFQGKEKELTKNEFSILELLMKKKTLVSRQEMMETLWETDEFVDENTLTVNINRLRKTLSSIGIEDFILTRRGMGYQLKEEI